MICSISADHFLFSSESLFEEFHRKTRYIHFGQFVRYLRFKLLKYKENNKKICNTFDHNFKNIPLYIMSNVSLERYYFVLYDGAKTLLKNVKNGA